MQKKRIFYVGMVCSDSYLKTIREKAFVGAAAGKMISIVSALRTIGERAVLVSLPFVGTGPYRQPGCLCRGDGIPALFLPTWRSPVLRKMLGTFSIAWFALRRVCRHDTILFYNHGIEYSLALLILRVRGVAVFQDIEDLPMRTESGMRGFLNRVGFLLMVKLSATRKVTVSNQIANSLKLNNFLAIQGVFREKDALSRNEKWAQLEVGNPLRVHFGGSLNTATGLDLFCDTVVNLDTVIEPFSRSIDFIVTGIGDLNRIRNLASSLKSHWLRIEVHQGVARRDYFKLLDSCHVSLSLRMPSSDYSSTTFPSKVIEIASRGLCLVSTSVSDVSDIFDDNSASILAHFSVQDLSASLKFLANNPVEVRRRADAGFAIAKTRFSPHGVGRALAAFMDKDFDLKSANH